MQINYYWDFKEFGFCFKVSKSEYKPYKYMIDINILFFDCWVNLIKKR